MELYLLNDRFQREDLVEGYESLIWTERFYNIGEIEIIIDPALAPRELLSEGSYLGLNRSDRVMVALTNEITEGDDGTEKLKITGQSLEYILNNRPNQTTVLPPTTSSEPVLLTGLPAALVRTLFDSICRNNTVIPEDNIPYLQPGVWTPPGSTPEPAEEITIQMQLGTLYESLQKICSIYHIGMRLVRAGDTGQIYFEVYTGSERTSRQTVRPAVIFSKALDNLSETTELRSIALEKTVAYVYAAKGSGIVYAPGVDSSVSGFERKVLLVDASDIDLEPGPALDAAIQSRGLQELAANERVIAFDGKIEFNGRYQYGVDYFLGDLVEQRSATGIATEFRVIEQIFVSDKEGQRSYPTLAVDLLITPGSWYSWSSSQVWEDAPGFWEDA